MYRGAVAGSVVAVSKGGRGVRCIGRNVGKFALSDDSLQFVD